MSRGRVHSVTGLNYKTRVVGIGQWKSWRVLEREQVQTFMYKICHILSICGAAHVVLLGKQCCVCGGCQAFSGRILQIGSFTDGSL